jgi:flagellar hook-associated protein 1 FlgK
MSLASALTIATGGLANVSAQLALVSHNVANASTPSYAVETLDTESVTAGGVGMGVLTGPAMRNVNQALQAATLQQNSTVAGLQTTQTALQAIDAISGTPGAGTDLGSLVGNLADQFSTLLSDPSNSAQQSAVVSSATALAQGINALSSGYTTQRQTAENGIVSEVGTVNSTLSTIGSLSAQIVAQQADGLSTADLENQRDAAVQGLSQLVSVSTLVQPNGNMVVTTASGTTLPTNAPTIASSGVSPGAPSGPLSIAGANVQPGSTYPSGGIGGIMLGGVDVTQQMTGGQIGANITLRDATLPTYQAELDEFSQNTASQFAAQGLSLFTDPSGNVPSGGGSPVQSGYVGFAAEIQVNPAVQTDPSLVVNGNVTVPGSPTGSAAFTPNPAGGPAGFTTLISDVLNYTFGTDAQSGVPQPAANTTGLGATGTLTAPFGAPATLTDFANAITGAEANDSASATSQLGTEQAVQTTLTNQLSSQSGVNLDQQMSMMIQLQNAYGANAKVMDAVQNMFTQLLDAVSS